MNTTTLTMTLESLRKMSQRYKDGHGGHWFTGEEIVRCRDCDVSQKDGTRCLLFAGWEPIEGSDEYELVSAEVEPDGFCKWGKRREDK